PRPPCRSSDPLSLRCLSARSRPARPRPARRKTGCAASALASRSSLLLLETRHGPVVRLLHARVRVREAVLRGVPRLSRRAAELVELLARRGALGFQILVLALGVGLGRARVVRDLLPEILHLLVEVAHHLLAVADGLFLLLDGIALHLVRRAGRL